MTIQSVRGTQDLLPSQSVLWQEVESRARRLAYHYGFREIRTPMFEKAELFVRGLGVMAGLVERELWTFHDKHGQKLALRADMTACVARAYSEHGLAVDGPTRLFYLAPVFLLGKETEEPSRQVHQFGVEVLNCENPAMDAEVIALANDFCQQMNLPEIEVQLNTLGCERCRPAYHDCLREFYAGRQGELCGTCKRKYRTHPLWTLSCPEPGCVSLAQVSPTFYGLLCSDCKAHFHLVKHYVRELGLPVNLNPRVVKDHEYYNRTIFQILSQGQVVGQGGRYDGLVAQLGGSDTPGVGFSANLETVFEIFSQNLEEAPDELDVLLIPEGEEATKVLLPVLHNLRQSGIRAAMEYHNNQEYGYIRLTARLVEANALRGHVVIEDLDSGDQEKVSPDRLAPRLLARLAPEENGRKKLMRPRRDARRDQPEAAPADTRSEADRDDASRRRRRRRRRGGTGGDGPEDVVEAVAESGARRPLSRSGRGDSARGEGERNGRTERESRPGRGDRPARGERAEREGRPEREGRGDREARPEREGRGDREGRVEREGRGDREGRVEREGRGDREARPEREGRGDREARPEREGRGDRETRLEREGRGDREARPEREGRERLGRGDRPEREGRGEREARPEREGRSEREARPEREGRGEREARPEREGRGEREARPEREGRGEREARPEREGRGDREGRPEREGREREGRTERGDRGDQGRVESPEREVRPEPEVREGRFGRPGRERPARAESAPEVAVAEVREPRGGRGDRPEREPRGGRDPRPARAGRGRDEEDGGKAFVPSLSLPPGGQGKPTPLQAQTPRTGPEKSLETAAPAASKGLNWSVIPGSKKARSQPVIQEEPVSSAPEPAAEKPAAAKPAAEKPARKRAPRKAASKEEAPPEAPAAEEPSEEAAAKRPRARRTR